MTISGANYWHFKTKEKNICQLVRNSKFSKAYVSAQGRDDWLHPNDWGIVCLSEFTHLFPPRSIRTVVGFMPICHNQSIFFSADILKCMRGFLDDRMASSPFCQKITRQIECKFILPMTSAWILMPQTYSIEFSALVCCSVI